MRARPERDEARTIHHWLTRTSKMTPAGTTNHLVGNTFSLSWFTLKCIRVIFGRNDYPVSAQMGLWLHTGDEHDVIYHID